MNEKRRSMAVVDAHLLLMKGNEVLLLLRHNTGYEDGKYSLVAGHLEDGESVVQAVKREAYEEVGITLAPEDIRCVHVMHNNSGGHRIGFFFLVRRWEGSTHNAEPHKCSHAQWFPVDRLPANVIAYQRAAIQHTLEHVAFSTFNW